MSDTAVKLPEIEHVKQRKDGLDVLADIYRYAELGFDTAAADDLQTYFEQAPDAVDRDNVAARLALLVHGRSPRLH